MSPLRHPRAGEQIGRFVVVDTLGQGAMGVVVRAHDPRLERMLAIKVVNPERSERAGRARARLLAEARALARISHPNVVAVYEVDVHDGLDYVAMELIDGIDLHRWLAPGTRHWRDIAKAFAAAAEGLHAVHRAGLVHRDVKPANILMGHDGQVRVGDFGIATAHAEGESDDPTLGSSSPTDSAGASCRLTEAGHVVGTPAYMAPEQHAGAPVGPAADQYALCVSLYEALWGERPFRGPQAQLASAKQQPPKGPPRAGVPTWLFGVVARGLRPDPEQRYPSMGELADALRLDLGARRRRRGLLAVAVVGAAAAAIAMRGDPPCAGAQAHLAGVWDNDARDAIARVFEASTRPYAGTVGSQIAERLDAYGSQWVQMHNEACAATRIAGEQSEVLLDRRMLCLARRRDSLVATLELLRAADDETVDSAYTMVGRLPAIAPCGDLEVMAASIAPPQETALRQQVEATRAEAARARASYDAGHYDEALTLAEQVTTRARELGYEPLLAEALFVRGDALQTHQRNDEARADLQQATWTAIAIGDDALAVEAASSLVWLESEYLRNFDAAAQWVQVARAELRRGGSPAAAAARVGNAIGASLSNVGRWDEALAEYKQALALVANDPAAAYTAHSLRVNIGNVYVSRGDSARANEIYERELAEMETMLGHDHPKVNLLRRLLADALSERGELDRALALGKEALASMERVYGGDGSEVAAATMGVAVTSGRAGYPDQALALYRRARDLFEASGDRGGLARALANIGSVEIERGAYDAAERALDRSLALLHEIHGDQSSEMVYPLVDKADVLLTQGRLDEALATAVKAEQIATATLEPRAHECIVAKQTRQGVLAEQGRIVESLALAREIVTFAEASDDLRPSTLPISRGNLAKLLVRTEAYAEALAVVDEGIRELGSADATLAVELSIIRAEARQGLGRYE